MPVCFVPDTTRTRTPYEDKASPPHYTEESYSKSVEAETRNVFASQRNGNRKKECGNAYESVKRSD